MAGKRLPCQVCRRSLSVRRDGLTKPHNFRQGSVSGPCPGAGYRQARWPLGQQLRHHAGSVWEVIGDHWYSPGADYGLRCVVGGIGGEEAGKTLNVHGEYMHRHGWTPVAAASGEGEQSDE